MKFLTKLERKFGRYAIPNLTNYMVGCAVIGYVLSLFRGTIIQYLQFNPQMILSGQVWRLVTWIVCPPTGLSFFLIFTLFLYYHAGRNLEYVWGTFHYNLYIFSGLLFNVIGSLVMYFITNLSIGTGTYYIYLTTLLAYFFTFPNMEIRFSFFIPIKMKWMGYIDLALIAVDFYNIGKIEIPYLVWGVRLQIIFALLNFFIFMILLKNTRKISHTEKKNQKNFKSQVREQMRKQISVHRCAICGRTKDEYPELEFRFCSKCKGNYEYCQEHLFTHSHVK